MIFFPTCITLFWHAFNFTIYPGWAKPYFHSDLSFQLWCGFSNVSMAARNTAHQSLHIEAGMSIASSSRTPPNWGVLLKYQCEQRQDMVSQGKKKSVQRDTRMKLKELSVWQPIITHLFWGVSAITFFHHFLKEKVKFNICVCTWKFQLKSGNKKKGGKTFKGLESLQWSFLWAYLACATAFLIKLDSVFFIEIRGSVYYIIKLDFFAAMINKDQMIRRKTTGKTKTRDLELVHSEFSEATISYTGL